MLSTTKVKVNYNDEKNGIELFFDSKPEQQVIEQMKGLGFRWHNRDKMWYAKQSQERNEFAESLIEYQNKTSSMDEADTEKTEPLEDSISQEDIDKALIQGNNVSDGKMRIFEQFQKNQSASENVAFLKDEYGIGGRSSPNKDFINENHDGKGIEIYKGISRDRVLLSWPQVAKRIGELIKADRYLNEQEKEHYAEFLEEKRNREVRSEIAEEYKSVIHEYNEYHRDKNVEDMLNQYVLSGCAGSFSIGEKTTWSLSKNNFVLPLMKKSLEHIITNKADLAERANNVLMALNDEKYKYFEPSVEEINPEGIKSAIFLVPERENTEHEENKVNEEIKKQNTFANSFEQIGDDWILDNSNIDIYSSKSKSCYLSDTNIYYKRINGYADIIITDLENANKKGKDCKRWSLHGTDLYSELKEQGVNTIKELYTALKEGKSFENIRTYESSVKGVNVFSPFIEFKPLKEIPDKWTKTTFIHALQSGQIFSGEMVNRYTDDYMYDSSTNFCKGIRLDMSSAAKNEMMDWDSLTTVYQGKNSPDGTIPLTLCCCNITKTYMFDLNCDIAEGKRRREEYNAGIDRYNKMMEASCKTISNDVVDLAEIYSIKSLDMNSNTNIYSIKNETLQGATIIDRMYDDKGFPVLGFEKYPIEDKKFYSVSNVYRKLNPSLMEDDRLIYTGNHEYLVSGKALKELTKEAVYLPEIRIGPHEGDYEKLIEEYSSRSAYSNFSVNKADYTETIRKMKSEYSRAMEVRTSSLSDLIKNASSKQKSNNIISFNNSINKDTYKDGDYIK